MRRGRRREEADRRALGAARDGKVDERRGDGDEEGAHAVLGHEERVGADADRLVQLVQPLRLRPALLRSAGRRLRRVARGEGGWSP